MRCSGAASWVVASVSVLLAACGDARHATGSGTGGAAGACVGGNAGASGSDGAGMGGASTDILEQIQAIPGVVAAIEEPSEIDGYRFFAIDFDQPADHDDPAGQHFTQRLALHHVDPAAPFVLV